MKEKPDLVQTLATYRANLREDLVALWKVWVPGTILNFAFMPMHARIPFVACISLLWTCILSTMRGGDVAHGEDMAGGGVTRATLVMLEEGLGELFTSPVELDRNKQHIMLTASGTDKKGWVALLAREVAESGGNVTHSKMVRLGNEFIVLMHVSVEPGEQRRIIKRLKKNKELKPMNIQCGSISRRQTGTYEQAVMGVRVRCQGADRYVVLICEAQGTFACLKSDRCLFFANRLGMLASIAESLAEAGLNVESLTTELQRHYSYSQDGRTDFVVTADCVTCQKMSKEQIQEMVRKLESIKDMLALDVVDIRVQHKV